MKEEQNINMIETLINNNSFVMFRSRNYYADEITEYTSIKNNSKLLYNNYNDIYTDLLIGLNKFTYNSHIILETKTNDMIEYNYFNNDFTNKVTKMDTNNKDYIYWYNMRFSQLKNTKGKILFLRGDYNYSVEIVRNYEIIIFYSAGKLLDNVKDWDKYITIYLFDDKDSESYIIGCERFINANKVQFLKHCSTKLVHSDGKIEPIIYCGLDRTIDLLIVAKTCSDNNNYHMIYNLLKYMNNLNINLTIVCCGFKNEKDINYLKSITNRLNINIKGIVSLKELNILYNKSKNLFVPTICDGNPRIISEAQYCGVNVIVSSKLDSGKTQTKFCDGYVVNYDKNMEKNIVDILQKSNDHEKIYEKSKRILEINIKNISDAINNNYNDESFNKNCNEVFKSIYKENQLSETFDNYFLINNIDNNIKIERIKDSSLKLFFETNNVNNVGLYFSFSVKFLSTFDSWLNCYQNYKINLPVQKYRISFNAKIIKRDVDFRFKIYTGIKYIVLEKEVTEDYQEFFLEEEFNFNTSSTYRIGFVNPKQNMKLYINTPLIKSMV